VGELGGTYKVLVRYDEGKRRFGRPGSRWKDNVKNNVGGIGFESVDCINVAQDSYHWPVLVTTLMEFLVL
jgi:hypothetical protein